jgi:hypothetical protein
MFVQKDNVQQTSITLTNIHTFLISNRILYFVSVIKEY